MTSPPVFHAFVFCLGFFFN